MQRIYCDMYFTINGKDYLNNNFCSPKILIPNEDCKIEEIKDVVYEVIPELENTIIFTCFGDYLFYINLNYFHHIIKNEFCNIDSLISKYANIITHNKNILEVVKSVEAREVTTDKFTTLESEENKTHIKILFVGKGSPNYMIENRYIPEKYSHIIAKEVDKIKNTKKYYIHNKYSLMDKSFVDNDTSIFQIDSNYMLEMKIEDVKIVAPVYISYYSDPECCIINGKPSKKLLANLNYFDAIVIHYTPKTYIETDNFIEFVNPNKNIFCYPGSDNDYPINIYVKHCMYDLLKYIPEKTSEKYIHEVIQIDTTVNEKYEKLKRVFKSLNIELI